METRTTLIPDEWNQLTSRIIGAAMEVHLGLGPGGYLRFTALPLGLLLDFNVAHLKEGIYRRINWPARPHPSSLLVESKHLSLPSVRTP